MTAVTWVLTDRATVPATEERVFRAINDAPAAPWPAPWPVMQLGNLAAPAIPRAIVMTRTRRWRPVAAALASGYGAWAASTIVKNVVERERPDLLLDGVIHRHHEGVEGLGFVSGHAAVAVAVATALWPYLGVRGWVAAAGLAALVGLGRIHGGAHVPLDVLGGQAIGVLVGRVTALLGTRRVPTAGPRTPSAPTLSDPIRTWSRGEPGRP